MSAVTGGSSHCTIDEMREAKRIGRRLFGDMMNIFHQQGLWFVGRFLDPENGPATTHGTDKRSPWRRKQEVFGAGRSLTEALAPFVGTARLYSIPGMAPRAALPTGYVPVFSKRGIIVGWRAPSGVFSRGAFPGRPGRWN